MQLQNIYLTLAWVLCIQLAAWGLGRPLYRLLMGKSKKALAGLDVIFSAALGYIVLAYIAFSLAALHILYPWIIISGTLACALGGAVQLFHVRPIFRLAPSWHDIPLLLTILFAASHIPNALYPVLEHDDNVYHLLIPKLYLESHAIVQLPSNMYANMPHIVEVLYTVPMAIGDFTAPKVLTLAFAFWTIAGLYLFARPLLGRFGAGLIPLIYVSGKNIQWHLGLAYIEPVIGFFLLCACLAFLSWRETRHAGFLRMAGLACGFAMASKYSAWFFSAAIMGVMGFELALARSTGPVRWRARIFIETALLALALIAPWLIKNALFTGNPIYPNLYGLLGGSFWSQIQEMQYLRSQGSAGGAVKTCITYLKIPWRLTLEDNFFYCPSQSISLMIFFCVALLRPLSHRMAQGPVLAIAALGFALWAFSVQQGRFLVAWVPVMAAAASLALVPLRNRVRPLAALFCGIMALGVYQILFQLYPYAPRIEAFTSPRAELLQRNLNFELCEFLNSAVPKDGKVIAFWDNRFFFLKRIFHADSAYEAPTGLAFLRKAGDPAVFVRELSDSHFTHVVINIPVASQYLNNELSFNLLDDRLYPASQLEKDRDLMTRFTNEYLEPLSQPGGIVVFRIRSELVAEAGGQGQAR